MIDGIEIHLKSFEIENATAWSSLGAIPVGAIPIRIYGYGLDSTANYVCIPHVHPDAKYNVGMYFVKATGEAMLVVGGGTKIVSGVITVEYILAN